MSTNPGDESWRDAGLVDQEEEPVSLGAERGTDEYRPRHSAGPDPESEADRADSADRAEQASAVPGAENDYP